MISIKSKKEISLMREAGLVAVETLEKIQRSLREGVTTGEIDKIAYDCITGYRMTPSFYHYRGFPGSVCASVNEVVIHGIPGPADCAREILSVLISAFATADIMPIAPERLVLELSVRELPG